MSYISNYTIFFIDVNISLVFAQFIKLILNNYITILKIKQLFKKSKFVFDKLRFNELFQSVFFMKYCILTLKILNNNPLFKAYIQLPKGNKT